MNLTEFAYERIAAIRRDALIMTPTNDKDHDMTYGLQPPPNAYDEIMNRLGQAKEVNNRDPFVPPGVHDLIVASVETYKDQKWGDSVRATFEIEQSSNPAAAPRSFAVKIWNLFKPSEFPSQATDADDFVAFVCALQGIKLGEHHAACKALIKRESEGGQLERQPARGARLKAIGQQPKPGINPKTQRPYAYVKVQWQNVPQDMARIAQTRAELDQRRPLGAPAASAPPHAAPQAYAPPTTQYQQPMPNAGGFVAAVTQAPPGWGAPMHVAAPQPPGGFAQYVQTAPQVPAAAPVAPWNPAWGPKPQGYPG